MVMKVAMLIVMPIREAVFVSVQFTSVIQSCLTLCDPMNLSTPGLPVHHQLLESTQIHVHWVGNAIQPSHPLSSPSPPTPNLSSIRSFQMSQLFASGGQSIGVSASTSVLPMNIQDWSPLGWTGWISLQCRATQDRWVMVESSDKMWSTGERNGKPFQHSCLENPVNSMKRQKDMTLKDELPRLFARCPTCHRRRMER